MSVYVCVMFCTVVGCGEGDVEEFCKPVGNITQQHFKVRVD